MLLLLGLVLVFVLVALTRPRRRHGLRDRYRPRAQGGRDAPPADPTLGLRDPSRPL